MRNEHGLLTPIVESVSDPILTLFIPGFFGSLVIRGGADLPPPSKNGGNGWKVPKVSWNLISYRDWCQTKGFTTFGYLEPPQLMVWKSDFFMGSVRFVRVPPYESWANWNNFCSSWENCDFFWGKKCCTLLFRNLKAQNGIFWARIGCFDVYDNDKYEVHSINLVEHLNFGWLWWLFTLFCRILILSRNLRLKIWIRISQIQDGGVGSPFYESFS